jgi:hypothetical protein
VTEGPPRDIKVVAQGVRGSLLTKDQVFRLWKCAVKDDDNLVDAVIERVYKEMVTFDLARAESVMQLIMDRDEMAAPKFGNLLQEMAIGDLLKTDKSRRQSLSAMQHLNEPDVPRELIRPIISINKTTDPDVNA